MTLDRPFVCALRASAVVLSLTSAAGALAAPAKGAKPGGKAPAASVPAVTLGADVGARLKSNDPAQVKAALDEVRVAGKAGAPVASDVAAILDRGTTVAMAIDVLDTLGDLEVEATTPSIVPYLQHRSPRVRQAAVKALLHTKGAASVKALRRALSDADPMVRGVAATGLGALKAKEAVPDLFVAFQHRIAEAAASIGQLCVGDECDTFLTQVGKQPFDVMSGGLDQILFRPTAEVNDDAKVKVVGRVRELGTQEANKFLRDVQKRWPKSGSARVRQAIEQAVAATGGGAGSEGGTQ